MQRPLVFTLLGAAAAAAGTFLPAVHVDVVGIVRYWDAATTESVILLLGAFIALLAAWRRERVGVAAGALAMWGALLWPWITGFAEEEEKNGLAAAARKVGDAATNLAKDIAWNFTDLSWGLFVVAAGCLLVTFGALSKGGGKGGKKPKAKKPREDAD